MKIKFRVWDKRNNRMIMPRKFATVIPVLDFDGNLGVMDTYKNWHWHGIVPENEYELMLFTGCHDKNGREIYEGDIVRIKHLEEIEEIEGSIHQIAYFGQDNYPAFDLKPQIDIDCNGLSYALAVCKIEVIGNIYENPELMEGN
jgi:uncharacterized phage protein (TIGR01671 family)